MTGQAAAFELVLQPGTGKAIEVRAGQVLRIEQIDGGQCVDFNCFNLHDYKEFMHCGRTRTVHGFHPSTGTFLWSAPPRERAMLYLLDDTVKRNDVLFPRCSAYLYESAYGYAVHTNCQDIQAEAQREYGLTPDDVHDSFNLFMCTEIVNGSATIVRQASRPGDYVDLLALMDVLAVPNVCGADIMRTSNFSLKPIKISVRQATGPEQARVPEIPALGTQRTPKDFRNPSIRVERELARDPDYVAQFTNVPLVTERVSVPLSAEEMTLLDSVRLEIYGEDRGAALRDVVFSWWEERYLTAASGAPDVSARKSD